MMQEQQALESQGAGRIIDEDAPVLYGIDTALIDVFGRELGAVGIALYNAIKRHALEGCWPGIEELGYEIGEERPACLAAFQRLRRARLIKMEGKAGGPGAARYRLLSVKRAAMQRAGLVVLPGPAPLAAALPAAGGATEGRRGAPAERKHRAGRTGPISAAYPVAVPAPFTPAEMPEAILAEIRQGPKIDLYYAMRRFRAHFTGQGFKTEAELWGRLLEWILEDQGDLLRAQAEGGTTRHLRALAPEGGEPVAPTAGQGYFRLAAVKKAAGGGA